MITKQESPHRIRQFKNALMMKLVIVEGGKGDPKDWSEHPFDRNPDFWEEFRHVVFNEEFTEADDDFLPDVYGDTYLRMNLALPKRGEPEPQCNRVTKRLRNANGLPIGKASDNPILDTRMYEVEYLDGEKYALSANVIAENMFAQIDEEGNIHVVMDKITGRRFDEATVKIHDDFVTTSSGTKCRRQTAQVVSMCIKWRDGNTTWVALNNIE